VEANQVFTQTCIGICSSSLETQNPERWTKSDEQKAAVFATQPADLFQPLEQEPDEEMLEFLESPAQPVQPMKHHTK